MEVVKTENAPAPLAAYEQAVIHNGLVYVSMQLPITAEGDTSSLMDIEEQTQLVLDNIKAIVEAAGSNVDKILRVSIYMREMNHASRMNTVYEEFFDTHKPARGVVGVAALPLGYSVAMDVVAAI